MSIEYFVESVIIIGASLFPTIRWHPLRKPYARIIYKLIPSNNRRRIHTHIHPNCRPTIIVMMAERVKMHTNCAILCMLLSWTLHKHIAKRMVLHNCIKKSFIWNEARDIRVTYLLLFGWIGRPMWTICAFLFRHFQWKHIHIFFCPRKRCKERARGVCEHIACQIMLVQGNTNNVMSSFYLKKKTDN